MGVFVRRPPVCRPSPPLESASHLSQNLLRAFFFFFQIWVAGHPRAKNTGRKMTILKKKTFSNFFCEFFNFSLTLYPMKAKIPKRYSSLKSFLNRFKLFLDFLLSSPHKVLFGIFEILGFWFLTIFFSFSLTWLQNYPNLQNATPPWNHFWYFFLTSPEFSSSWFSLKFCFWIFDILSFWF